MDVDTRAQYRLFIDGEYVPASSSEYFTTDNPATAEIITKVAAATDQDVDRAVEAATDAFREWRETKPIKRGQIAQQIADGIREQADELAALESLDQGKPLSQARADVENAVQYFKYYGGAADKLEGRSVPLGEERIDLTMREPYGVSAQIVPWNFPLSLTARSLAPALVAGNAVVVKPAPTTSLTALYLAEICRDAGIPDGTVNVVTGGSKPGTALTSHENIDTITFTGSVPTGRAVMESAAKTITPVTLELGGKNPALVLEEADLDVAVDWIARGIFSNAGQICSAADRAIVTEPVYDEFVDRIVEVAESYELGAGIDDPDMGPLNHAAHLETVVEYAETGVAEGASLETGGDSLDRPGYFFSPTVFSDVEPTMQIATEEIFGPILTVIPAADVEEAITIANESKFGLTGGVFSQDINRALRTVRRIDAGSVYVNEWFGGSIQTPFGGYKQSGIGRENGLEGLETYLQTKTLSINLSNNRP